MDYKLKYSKLTKPVRPVFTLCSEVCSWSSGVGFKVVQKAVQVFYDFGETKLGFAQESLCCDWSDLLLPTTMFSHAMGMSGKTQPANKQLHLLFLPSERKRPISDLTWYLFHQNSVEKVFLSPIMCIDSFKKKNPKPSNEHKIFFVTESSFCFC